MPVTTCSPSCAYSTLPGTRGSCRWSSSAAAHAAFPTDTFPGPETFPRRRNHVIQKKMFLGMTITDGYGNLHGAWRAPHVDPNTYADFDANVRYAQAAERGKFAFLFTP